MANTNITTGYTYIPVAVLLPVLLPVLSGLKLPVAWCKALASLGVAMSLPPQYIVFLAIVNINNYS